MKKYIWPCIAAILVTAIVYGQSLPIFWSSATGFQSRGVTYSQLGIPYNSTTAPNGVPQQNGTSGYCTDCGVGANNLCVSGGTGSPFERVNNVWTCGLINAGILGSVPDPMSVNTIKGTGVTPQIQGMIWNKTIDPTAFGCVQDINADYNVVATSGSTTLTSTSGLWSSLDCHSGPGCTGPVDKIARLDDWTLVREKWSGTITRFNNSNSIGLSSAPVVNNGDGFELHWQSPSDSCLTTIASYIKTYTNGIVGPRVLFSYTLGTTQPWTVTGSSGVAQGTGCGLGPQLLWYGTTPDQPMVIRGGNFNFNMSNMCIIGGSAYPPSFGVNDRQNSGLGDGTNALNTLAESTMGTVSGTSIANNNIPDDIGGSAVLGLSSDVAQGATSLPINTMSANFTGPSPNQLIALVDTSFGATNGTEFVMTAQPCPHAPTCYNRGANPIVISPTDFAHPAASTHVDIAFGTMNNGYGVDINSTQDDKNHYFHDQARDVNTCIFLGDGQIGGNDIIGPSCNQTFFGFFSLGVNTTIMAPEMEGVGFKYAIANNSNILVLGHNEQNGGAGSNQYGPGFSMSDPGMTNLIESRVGFQNLTTFTCLNCPIQLVDLNGTNDIIELGIGQAETVDYENANLVGGITNGTPLSVHNHGVTTSDLRNVRITYKGFTNSYLQPLDAGSTDPRAFRWYDFEKLLHTIGEAPENLQILLTGPQSIAYNTSVPHNEQDSYGYSKRIGTSVLVGLGTAATPTGTCGTVGTTDYWYKVAYSIHGRLQKVSTGFLLPNCGAVGTLGANPNIVVGFPGPGGDVLHVYGNVNCAHGTCNSDPNTEVEVVNGPVNNQPSSSNSPNTLFDTGAVIGTAYSNYDQTGSMDLPSFLNWAKLTGAPTSAIGAGNCQLFVVAGTNAGSCKLQAICGTSTTPVTITDNIGTGC